MKEEAVILVLEEHRFFAVSEVGARALELLDGRASVADIMARLQSEYEVSEGQLEADLLPFFEQLISTGVLQLTMRGVGPPPPDDNELR